ncbi:C-C motif chemokine 3-like isoform X2 [Antechinus flavipes]|uniref:C-C motif chemokine 3-like isoform X2 n=1 Tax=Antechinus flavipes TaxID=38775 RepID=UPI002236C17C|nr:C-C motif chemokine 3-like isoform X2 [Antechinus flavipes]
MISLAVFSILIISIPGFGFESETYGRYDIPQSCCHSYSLRKIPYKIVTDFYETSSLCHKPGVMELLLERKGRESRESKDQEDFLKRFSWSH